MQLVIKKQQGTKVVRPGEFTEETVMEQLLTKSAGGSFHKRVLTENLTISTRFINVYDNVYKFLCKLLPYV